MFTFILTTLILGAASATINDTGLINTDLQCNSCIEGRCYTSTDILAYLVGLPTFDLTENILYFTYEQKAYSMKIPKDLSYKGYKLVPGVAYFARGQTVNQKTRELYVWMEHNDNENMYAFLKNSSWVYNPVTNETKEFVATEEAIKEMHFKDKLYFTLKFRNGLFVYNDSSTTSVQAFKDYNITQFIIDKKEDVYATTESGVYRVEKGDDSYATLFVAKSYSVSVDKDENLYLMDPIEKTIFKLNYSNDEIAEVGAITSDATDRFIFDKYDNILVKKEPTYGEGKPPWAIIQPSGQCKIENREGKKTIVKVPSTNSMWPNLFSTLQNENNVSGLLQRHL